MIITRGGVLGLPPPKRRTDQNASSDTTVGCNPPVVFPSNISYQLLHTMEYETPQKYRPNTPTIYRNETYREIERTEQGNSTVWMWLRGKSQIRFPKGHGHRYRTQTHKPQPSRLLHYPRYPTTTLRSQRPITLTYHKARSHTENISLRLREEKSDFLKFGRESEGWGTSVFIG